MATKKKKVTDSVEPVEPTVEVEVDGLETESKPEMTEAQFDKLVATLCDYVEQNPRARAAITNKLKQSAAKPVELKMAETLAEIPFGRLKRSLSALGLFNSVVTLIQSDDFEVERLEKRLGDKVGAVIKHYNDTISTR